nr:MULTISPECIES: hypothetical protein [Thermoanaerobacter]
MIRIFPSRESAILLIGTLLMEQQDEKMVLWQKVLGYGRVF